MNLHNLRIVLVRPKHSGNIGAAARAMRNCGVRDLHLVNPAPIDRNLADALAVHATDVLETMQTHTSLRAAVGPCGMVVGTTCRTGLYREDAEPLEARVPEIVARLGTNRVALVFGPEDTGLTNRDLDCCHTLLTIPTDPACASLNLAQAVLLCCYAVYRAASEPVSASPTVLATAERQELMYEKLRARSCGWTFFRATTRTTSCWPCGGCSGGPGWKTATSVFCWASPTRSSGTRSGAGSPRRRRWRVRRNADNAPRVSTDRGPDHRTSPTAGNSAS